MVRGKEELTVRQVGRGAIEHLLLSRATMIAQAGRAK